MKNLVEYIMGGYESPSINDPNTWMSAFFGGPRTMSGVRVTPQKALGLSTYFACLQALSSDVAKLPFMLYRQNGSGKERATDHPVYKLIHDAPNPRMGAMAFRETMQGHAAAWGNAYAEIQRDALYRPVSLWLIHPSRVEVKFRDGEPYYRVRMDDKALGFKYVEMRAEDLFHLHGLGDDGYQGYSVASLAAETLGSSIAAQTYGSAFFANGANAGGVLEHPGKLSPDARQNLRESWQKVHAGAENAGKTAILEEGMKFNKISVPPEEAQYLQTREFNVEEVCRWFRMPPSKIGHYKRAQGWSTLEMTNTEYVVDTLTPWTERWESEVDRKLLTEAEQGTYFSEHLFLGLLKGDSDKRAAFYKAMFEMKAITPNEIRALENMNPLPGGDEVPEVKAAPAPVPATTATVQTSSVTFTPEPVQAKADPLATLRPCLTATVDRCHRRAKHAHADARKRCKTNLMYAEWCNDFEADHMRYMQSELASVAEGAGVNPDAFKPALAVYLKFEELAGPQDHDRAALLENLETAMKAELAIKETSHA